jgi:hypothetical protein
VPIVDLPAEDEMAAAVSCIDAWVARELARGGLLVAAERQDVTDRTASQRWYLRFKGEEFMPAPEENVADTLAYLMRCNANLYGMWFSLGPEDAVYLVGKVPAALIDDDELDRIAGSSVLYVDDHFPTAMTLAHPTVYRRRPRR